MASSSQPPPPLDERQPLLAKPTDEEGLEPVPSSEPLHSTSDPSTNSKDVEWTWTSVAWYTGLMIAGLVALGLLIKGFIDSGDTNFDLKKALKDAIGGGLSGAAAMVLQVLTLMPLRTVMNYQYRYGTSTTAAIETLYHDGGWTRYYQGLSAALIQGPVARFGDTAANVGMLALLNSNTYTRELPEYIKTVFASFAAAAFRIVLTPIDTVKTTLQTQGRPGIQILKNRIRRYGITTMWYGALATAAATFVGHYPWFGTYNYLQRVLPPGHSKLEIFGRQAFIGFVASVISDTVSNSLRVVKTYRQVNETRIGYFNAARAVVAVDGWMGLLGRGLKTKILANGLQGLMFSVLWKFFMDLWNKKTEQG